MEGASLARLALDPEAPAHELDQLGRNRQAQTGPAVGAGDRTIRLGERIEDRLLLACANTDPPLPHREVQPPTLLLPAFRPDVNHDLAAHVFEVHEVA